MVFNILRSYLSDPKGNSEWESKWLREMVELSDHCSRQVNPVWFVSTSCSHPARKKVGVYKAHQYAECYGVLDKVGKGGSLVQILL